MRYLKITFLVLAISSLIIGSCANRQKLIQLDDGNASKTCMYGNYTGSFYKGNYIWGAAMNLAWNELTDSVLKERLSLATDNKLALEMVAMCNKQAFTKNDLDNESYYIKSGLGPKTIAIINKEVKKKFPQKSFNNLNIMLQDTDIISYAYFKKDVAYLSAFSKPAYVMFKGKKVKGFSSNGSWEQQENIEILKYESNDKFISKIKLKDEQDQLLFAKGYDMTNPDAVIKDITDNNSDSLSTIDTEDQFEAPQLHLECLRIYTELQDKHLSNKHFELYKIGQMFENITFTLDEKGARIENEGIYQGQGGAIYNAKPII